MAYIGTSIGATQTASWTAYTLTTSEADVGASITLSKGIWLINYEVSMVVATGASASNITYGRVFLANSINAQLGTTTRALVVKTVAAVSNEITATLSASHIMTVSGIEIAKLRAVRVDSAGTGSAAINASSNGVTGGGTLVAVRIA